MSALALVVAISAVVTPIAHAYIDPGLGAMIWQMILAAVAGALFFVKSIRVKLVGFFKRLFSGDGG